MKKNLFYLIPATLLIACAEDLGPNQDPGLDTEVRSSSLATLETMRAQADGKHEVLESILDDLIADHELLDGAIAARGKQNQDLATKKNTLIYTPPITPVLPLSDYLPTYALNLESTGSSFDNSRPMSVTYKGGHASVVHDNHILTVEHIFTKPNSSNVSMRTPSISVWPSEAELRRTRNLDGYYQNRITELGYTVAASSKVANVDCESSTSWTGGHSLDDSVLVKCNNVNYVYNSVGQSSRANVGALFGTARIAHGDDVKPLEDVGTFSRNGSEVGEFKWEGQIPKKGVFGNKCISNSTVYVDSNVINPGSSGSGLYSLEKDGIIGVVSGADYYVTGCPIASTRVSNNLNNYLDDLYYFFSAFPDPHTRLLRSFANIYQIINNDRPVHPPNRALLDGGDWVGCPDNQVAAGIVGETIEVNGIARVGNFGLVCVPFENVPNRLAMTSRYHVLATDWERPHRATDIIGGVWEYNRYKSLYPEQEVTMCPIGFRLRGIQAAYNPNDLTKGLQGVHTISCQEMGSSGRTAHVYPGDSSIPEIAPGNPSNQTIVRGAEHGSYLGEVDSTIPFHWLLCDSTSEYIEKIRTYSREGRVFDIDVVCRNTGS